MVKVVVGGQYGSEAKAKAAVKLLQEARKDGKATSAVRCGGPNAGHTVWFGTQKYVLRLVPSGVAVPGTNLYIAPGAMVDVDLLLKEISDIEAMGVSVRDRLFIDPQAAIVDRSLVEAEKDVGLGATIGSTQTGTGSTAAARAMRKADLVKGEPRLKQFTLAVSHAINQDIDAGNTVVVEGTQGFGLSLWHSGHYPFCTSKDTTAASFLAEAGISPILCDDIMMVIRTYPIRVGGNSGWMYQELTWDVIKERCGSREPLVEMTSVTKRVRRVGEFDWDLVRHAVEVNRPTGLALHGLDYLEWADRGKRRMSHLSSESVLYLLRLQQELQVPLKMVFTGPHQDDMIYDARGL